MDSNVVGNTLLKCRTFPNYLQPSHFPVGKIAKKSSL